jgi:bifunctional non-homologous end joining protein LigD
MSNFEALHSRANDPRASACAFNLLMCDGDDLRRKPYSERKALLLKVLRSSRSGIQYVEHTEGDGVEMFKAVCKLGLEGIVSKKLDAPYKSKSDYAGSYTRV